MLTLGGSDHTKQPRLYDCSYADELESQLMLLTWRGLVELLSVAVLTLTLMRRCMPGYLSHFDWLDDFFANCSGCQVRL